MAAFGTAQACSVCPKLGRILLKKSYLALLQKAADSGQVEAALHSGGCEAGHWLHLSQFAEVLGGCSEVELVFCSIGTA